ncbi:TetR/AcrR family transcriptional regulator [Streptomyces sp. NPDC058773]|uniref:TetR/AcrR family transcriptional regulator n=1 Tax=Streptomyces sp. NPDC058773 TaxID=3346632 RepID=UPI0036D13F17
MPSARESLLDAAYTALTERSWAAVRMVDVAAAAGVSRQTLYHEFGSKEGLARALVRRETDNYLAGVDRALSPGSPAAGARRDAAGRVAAAAAWTLRTARTNPLVRAVLTGCWSDRLPAPSVPAAEAAPPPAVRPGIPAQRAAPPGDGPLPGPAELVGRFCDRAVAALEPDWPEEQLPALCAACETAARLTLACVVAPVTPGRATVRRSRRELEAEAVSRLVRGAFAGMPAGGRRGERR